MKKEYVFVYITNPDQEVARKLARTLLENRLIACANMFPIRSLYWWEGAIEDSEEVVLICKTERRLFEEVKELVRKAHPYTCPCIVALGLEEGNEEFLDWISTTVKG